MKTKIITINENNINKDSLSKAAGILRSGGLVAFPTETVYGLGANALDEEAISKIYTAKGRPSDNPLIIHISHKDVISKYAVNIPKVAEKLMDKFWPGPLTIILERSKLVKDFITGGLDTVAIRIPSNKIANNLISLSNIPIAAPSANLSGRPSPTSASHVIEDLNGKIDMIIDGGKVNIGLESTVLDLTVNPPLILRPGGVTLEMLREAIGHVEIDKALNKINDSIPKAPGMKYKHYAPKGNLIVVEGSKEKVIEKINLLVKEKEQEGFNTAVIATTEYYSRYEASNVKIIGSDKKQEEIASNLFELLRQMDDEGIEYIFTQSFSDDNIGMAIMNRLLKAAGNQKIIV